MNSNLRRRNVPVKRLRSIIQLLFGLSGRLSRSEYVVLGLVSPIVVYYFARFGLGWIFSLVLQLVFFITSEVGANQSDLIDYLYGESGIMMEYYVFLIVSVGLPLVFALWVFVVATIKRFHDFGFGGGWAVVLLIVFFPAGLVMALFKSSVTEDNEYGPAPTPKY